MQNIVDATRLAASGYPGGLAALCVRLDWNYETARKELAGAAGFKLGADRALAVSQLCIEAGSTHCRAVINAFAAGCGGFVKVDVHDCPEQRSLMGATVQQVRTCTDLLSHVTAARNDGVINDNERKVIERDVAAAIANLQAVLAQVQRENEAARQRHTGAGT